MFTPIIFKEANFHIYKINEKCEVIKNDESLSEEDYIYHSTNGYDYILLEKIDGSLTMYPLDQVVYNSFNTIPIVDGYKCIHIDGNLRNNNLYNLERVEDIEEWRVITYPGVPENTYQVSSWGNIKKMNSNQYKAKSFDKFKKYYMMNVKSKKYKIHRIIAYEFLQHNEWNQDFVINHIDNNGFNNHILNLEIVTIKQNTYHARLIGAVKSIRTEEMIRTFCELYVKYEGNIKKVRDCLKELNLIEYFNHRRISQIIRKDYWTDITDEYFKLGDYELPYKDQLTENEIRYICELLVKYNMSCAEVFKKLQSDCNNRIMLNDIKKIRYKYQWTNISDKYFT